MAAEYLQIYSTVVSVLVISVVIVSLVFYFRRRRNSARTVPSNGG
jgi:hypothetical protein